MPTYAANVERDPSLLLFDGASLSRWKQSDDRWAEKGDVRYDLGRLVDHLQVGAKWMRSSRSYDSTRVAEWDFPGTPLDGTLLAASGLIQKDVPTILHGEYYYGAVMSRQTVISAITDSGTARGTIREALFQREPAGLIYRRDRSGWYVSPPAITYDPTRWTGFMACVIEQHRIPRPKCCRSKAWRVVRGGGHLPGRAGTPPHHVTRRRSIDDRAVLIGRIVVDPALAPGLARHDLGSSLTGTLGTEYGLKVVRKRVDMRPCALTTSVAEMLDAKPGTPGLLVVRISFNADERVIEYDHEYWRHDAIRVLVDLDKRS